MSGPRRWTALATELLQECEVFRVSRTQARSPRTGDRHAFYRIDSVDWVNVVPITDDGRVVMVRQYRHGLGELTLEIPGGMIDPGESPAEAAARELLEETGYRAAELVPIGTTSPNPALFGNRVHSFLGRDARRVGEVRNDGSEETAVELFSQPELRRIVRAGGVDHALVLAALHFLDLHREETSGR
jgi:8-oxo-dGTP pyrophosphatase MutT (NUDIX family)